MKRAAPLRAAALAAVIALPPAGALLACGGKEAPPPGVASGAAGPAFSLLRASSGRIVNESGEGVVLRGLNLGGWLVKEGYILHFPGTALDAPSEIDRAIVDLAGAEGPRLLEEWREQWITEADLTEIRSLGFNSVRLPLHYALLWDVEHGAARPEGLAFLDRVVGWCESHRLWLFLDLHCAPGGQNAGNISDSDGTARLYADPANQDATIALWQAIAARYRERGAVIGGYDLLNEPVWQPGVDVARFFERLARAVRAADGRHAIVLEGNTWASDFSIFGAPFDDDLVYSFHKYWNANDEASIAPFVAFRERYGVPLWLGETGENGNPWYRDALALVRRHEIGWCFWPWKKVWTDNDPLSVEPPAGSWERITEYFEGKRPRPTPEEAAAAVRALLQAAQVSRCRRNAEVIAILQAS